MIHLSARSRAAAFAASAVGLLASTGAAPAASPVTVHRGAETTMVRPAGDGLAVVRGAPVTIQPPRPEIAASAPDVVAAGRRLWIVDAEGGRLRVCVLARTTMVGERVIRCAAGDLPE